MIARWVKSDFQLPDAVYQSLSIYLLLAIGLKGGAAVSQTPITELLEPEMVTLLLGVATPLSAFFLMRKVGKLSQIDAAATAAHQGSVSAVIFLAAIEAAKIGGLGVEGSGGAKTSNWEGRHIQIDVIVSEESADKILNRVAAEDLDTYSVISYESDVRVIRSQKFSNSDHTTR